MLSITIFLWCFFSSIQCQADKAALLELPNLGQVQGQVLTAYPSGHKYLSYQSIPYAQPPLGKLRFLAPVKATPWSGILDGTKSAPQCPQLSLNNNRRSLQQGPLNGTEDCLYLNVYTPENVAAEKKLLPVMVWIHGGAFIMHDGGPTFYGPDYFMSATEHPVVLVTLNYRLGILGFLSFDDQVVSGNMGLKDQNLALQWIKSNIGHFGGDPDQVTIFGESAGGMSVMSHVLSPLSADLFHTAIVQSGPVVNVPFLHLSHKPAHYAHLLADQLDCYNDGVSSDMLECLQAKSVEDVVDKTGMFEQYMFTVMPWIPIVDDHNQSPFLPGCFKEMLQNGSFNKVPMIMGGTKDEGAMFMPQFLNNPELFDTVRDDFEVQAPVLFLGVDEDEVTEEDSSSANIMRLEYFDGLDNKFTEANWKKLQKWFSHVHFLAPIDLQMRMIRDNMDEPIFYYNYRHKFKYGLPFMMGIKDKDLGVCHADELFTTFRVQGLDDLLTPDDYEVGKKVINMWTRFATTGIPSQDWEPARKGHAHPPFAILDTKPLKMVSDIELAKKTAFFEVLWEVLEGYRHRDFQDHPAVKVMLNSERPDNYLDDTDDPAEDVTDEDDDTYKAHDEL